MAVRYYLDRAVKLSAADDAGIEPMHLAELNALPGLSEIDSVLPAEFDPNLLPRQFHRMFYVLRVVADDFSSLDGVPGLFYITRQRIIDNADLLASHGIDTTGLTLTTPRKQIERRIFQWLTTRDADLSVMIGRAGETIE